MATVKKTQFSKRAIAPEPSEPLEGQLALDVYQTNKHIIVVAPIGGAKREDINVSITEDVLTIKGARAKQQNIDEEDYFTQECFWGNFSRSIVLPAAVDASKINASYKDAVLTVTIPKTERSKTKVIRINSD